jgi:malate dehydrogenase (oxaloacetate-decarboxylating)(NADP+)
LITAVAPAVAKAAMDSGVAAKPIKDLEKYRAYLSKYVHQSGLAMRPLFRAAHKDPQRVCFTEGEEERVLRAVQTVLDENLAVPVLIGRPHIIERKIRDIGLRMRPGTDVEVVDCDLSAHTDQSMYPRYWETYQQIMSRRGVSPSRARDVIRNNPTVLGACMVRLGEADAVLCGSVGPDRGHLRDLVHVLGMAPGSNSVGSLAALLGGSGRNPHLFVADPFVVPDPTPEQLADIVTLAAEGVRRFGIQPKVALVSHSNFGTVDDVKSRKMREVLRIVRERHPQLMIDGEMRADVAMQPLVSGGCCCCCCCCWW